MKKLLSVLKQKSTIAGLIGLIVMGVQAAGIPIPLGLEDKIVEMVAVIMSIVAIGTQPAAKKG